MSFSGRERNAFFISDSGRGFRDLSSLSGADLALDGRAVARADLDHDGDEDLVVVSRNAPLLRVFRNDLAKANAVRLRFDEPMVGARIDATCRDRLLRRDVFSSDGFAAQNSRTITIGLADCRAIDTLVIRRGPRTFRLANLPANRTYVIREGVIIDQRAFRQRQETARPRGVSLAPDLPRALSRRLSDPSTDLTYIALSARWCTACRAAKPRLEKFAKRNDFALREVYFEDSDARFGFNLEPMERSDLRGALPRIFGAKTPPLPSGFFIDRSGEVIPVIGVPTQSDIPASFGSHTSATSEPWAWIGLAVCGVLLAGGWRAQSTRKMRPGAGGDTGECVRK